MAAGEPARGRRRPTAVTETLVAGAVVGAAPAKLDMTADEAVTQLYSNHYRSLVRLAGLLVRDEPTAEEVVQECFIAMHDGWHRVRGEGKALSYLQQAVVNRARSGRRHGGGPPQRGRPQRAQPRAGRPQRRGGRDQLAGTQRRGLRAASPARPATA